MPLSQRGTFGAETRMTDREEEWLAYGSPWRTLGDTSLQYYVSIGYGKMK